MPICKIPSASDEMMTLLEVNSRYFPVLRIPNYDQEQEIRTIPEWEAREDDILICAYPKSGTHWIWEVVGMLLSGKPDRIPLMKESAMLEGSSKEHFDELKSPRILNTHLLYKDLPKSFIEKKCKQIYILRHPKDVSVSFYNHHTRLLDYEYTGTWKNYLNRFIEGKVDYGSWCDYVLHWEKEIGQYPSIPVHTVTYEDMKANDVEEIKRLANFLNVEISDDLVKNIADNCTFTRMKKDKDPLEDLTEWKDRVPGMYRKGEVGDWKNWFTVSQSEKFDSFYKGKLKGSNVAKLYGIGN